MRAAGVCALALFSAVQAAPAAAVAANKAGSTGTAGHASRSHLEQVPVVIWHGLGDRYDNPGLVDLGETIERVHAGTFVHFIRLDDDGSADQRATFFGDANEQVARACAQLNDVPELVDANLNPSRLVDFVGFSQGGQLVRALVERCELVDPFLGDDDEVKVLKKRHLVTLGAQHMGVNALPPCSPSDGLFSPCRLMHSSLVAQGIYSSWAQRHVVPAQYFRDTASDARFAEYLATNDFLRDINNEHVGDALEPTSLSPQEQGSGGKKRNEAYKTALTSLARLVLVRFSQDATVVPPHSAHFAVPDPNSTACDDGTGGRVPGCWDEPLDWDLMPLYRHDFVGLKTLDRDGKVTLDICEGAHMQITDECWERIVSTYLGPSATASTFTTPPALVLQQ